MQQSEQLVLIVHYHCGDGVSGKWVRALSSWDVAFVMSRCARVPGLWSDLRLKAQYFGRPFTGG